MPPPQERQRNDLSYKIHQFAQSITGLPALHASFEGIESQAELSLPDNLQSDKEIIPGTRKIIGFAALCILGHQKATDPGEKATYLSRSLEALEAAETTISQEEIKQNKPPEFQFLTLVHNEQHYALSRCYRALAETSELREEKRGYLEKAFHHLEFVGQSCISYAPVHLEQAQLLTQLATLTDDPADILSYLERARKRIQTARKIGTDEPDSITGIRYAIPAEEDSLHQFEAQINEMWERYAPPSEATTPTSSPDLTRQAAATISMVDIAAAREEAQRQEAEKRKQEAEKEAQLRQQLAANALPVEKERELRTQLAEMLIKRDDFTQAVQILEEGYPGREEDVNYTQLLNRTYLRAADALLSQATGSQNQEEATRLHIEAFRYIKQVLDRNPYCSKAINLRLKLQQSGPLETADSKSDRQKTKTAPFTSVLARAKNLFPGR